MINQLKPDSSIDLAKGPVGFSHPDLVANLRKEAAYSAEGKTARTMLRSPGLTLVLTVLKEGRGLEKHKAPGPIHVICLEGRMEFAVADGDTFVLESHQSVAVPAKQMHSVQALSDCAFLISIGGKE